MHTLLCDSECRAHIGLSELKKPIGYSQTIDRNSIFAQ